MCLDALPALIATLEAMSIEDAFERLTTEAIENGGSLVLANPANSWSAHTNTLSVHQAFADGDTEETLVRNWIRTARTMALSRLAGAPTQILMAMAENDDASDGLRLDAIDRLIERGVGPATYDRLCNLRHLIAAELEHVA